MADLAGALYAVSEDGRTVCVKYTQYSTAETDIFIDCGFEPTEVDVIAATDDVYHWDISMPAASHISGTAYDAADGFTVVGQGSTQPIVADQLINAATAASGDFELDAAAIAAGGTECVGIYLGDDVVGEANDIVSVVLRR